MNVNWPRWITASIYKHFDDNKSTLEMYAEGDQPQREPERNRFEVRITGPDIAEKTKGHFHLTCIIDVFVISVSNEADIYDPERNIGIVANIFSTMIPVYEYGDGDAFLACLQRIEDPIRITRFPKAAGETNPLQRTSIESTYRIHLEG